jgi:uncharacterized protein (TIGR02996 family)
MADGFPKAPEGALATGAGNRRALLLEAVIADPTNIDARLVYADALAGANDPRGEFIQLDTALDGHLSIRKRDAMKRQRDALYAANAKTWWPYSGVRLRVDKGFAVAIGGFVSKINAAAAVFATDPVTEVEVRGVRDLEGVERLLEASWLPRVRHLIVRGKIGNAGFRALVEAPQVQHLAALNVTGNDIEAEGMASLERHLPNCRSLVLSNNRFGNEGLVGLAKWQHLAALEMLYLGNCDLTAVGVGRLLDGPPLAKLVKLALTDNKLGNEIGNTLAAKTRQLPALRHLDLVKTGIGTVGATQVSQAPLPSMTRLDLRANRIDATLVATDPRITT